jgi:hypothetical protein
MTREGRFCARSGKSARNERKGRKGKQTNEQSAHRTAPLPPSHLLPLRHLHRSRPSNGTRRTRHSDPERNPQNLLQLRPRYRIPRPSLTRLRRRRSFDENVATPSYPSSSSATAGSFGWRKSWCSAPRRCILRDPLRALLDSLLRRFHATTLFFLRLSSLTSLSL